MSFEYDFSATMPMDFSGEAGILVVVWLVCMLFALAFSVLSYVLQSVGMYKIAKRRGIHNAWLSWIPLGNMWILGSISDQYQYVVKGRVKNRRKALLGLTIAMYVLMIIMYIAYFAMLFSGFLEAANYEATAGDILVPALLVIASALAISVISIIAVVFQYMALYDLFVSCNPNSAVAFLILSIFLGVTLPFFVFSCRNKDYGMPPRRPAPYMQQPAWQQTQPGWQNASQPAPHPEWVNAHAQQPPAAPTAPVVEPAPEQKPEESAEE